MSLLHVGQSSGMRGGDWQQLPISARGHAGAGQIREDGVRSATGADGGRPHGVRFVDGGVFCHLTAANERAGRIPTTDTLRPLPPQPAGR